MTPAPPKMGISFPPEIAPGEGGRTWDSNSV